ncbi:putative metal-dependent hydrolase, partial [Vibrio harveyi]
QICCLT